ncbi:hypothetical protein HELRODRAFT_192589 [Helobdella robusta]|uniref:E3 ubiquitin protein ligase n=1 Tax=Helobdella robusta TaxID=6412 RepID=T1FU40_HELRO|nr:hypothetical protein HELRODRAFT_192589 [Helobdella robusta]ESO00725.1 hypothetical protein HELRODRAFT_192589 [Helobdella robusta]
MSSKRAGEQSSASNSGSPPAKKAMTQLKPIEIGPVRSLEDMDIKVLQFQNKKLVERIDQRRKHEEELKRRIEQLEQRQATDDAVLCIVNRYWNQLDEDVRVLLQRFDAEGVDEDEKENESSAVTSFLTLLSQWDRQEIEDKLSQRVEFSERAIGKLLQAYDRLLQRKEKIWQIVKNKNDSVLSKDELDEPTSATSSSGSTISTLKNTDADPDSISDNKSADKSNKDTAMKIESDIKNEADSTLTKSDNPTATTDADNKNSESDSSSKEEKEKKSLRTSTSDSGKFEGPALSETVMAEMDRLMEENKRLHNIVTQMHQKHHEIILKNSELQDKNAAAETESAELKNHLEEAEYHLESSNNRVTKLDKYLNEVLSKLKTYQEGEIKVQGGGEGVSKNKFNEMMAELEEQKELAMTRLGELEKLQEEHEESVKENEKLKIDLATLPESVITETTEYKCLQSQFSVLYNESVQMRAQLEECRNLFSASKNAHLRQIEQMELEELAMQKKLRKEMIEMEDLHAQVCREHDNLRMEFEQTLAANEQTGPINREMRNLISSLKTHNEQLKGEVQRYKRKLKEAYDDVEKLKQEVAAAAAASQPSSSAAASSSSTAEGTSANELGASDVINKEQEELERHRLEAEIIKDLKCDIKKLQEKEKEIKIHLDSLKSMSKEGRDKAQLMASEKKAKMEFEESRNHMRRLQQELDRKERRKHGDDDVMKRLRKLEEHNTELQRCLSAQKQEEEAMLNEMEVTGQAFEDMQEQNVRLMQQLREKDDANFKLMSERIKSNQIQKLLRDEKDVLAEQVETLQHQVEAQNLVVRKLEEKERLLMATVSSMDKDLTLRQQAAELHKRKAVESVQTATDLKLHLDKYHSQLKEAQQAVADKTTALQQQSFKYRRMQEELAVLRKKLDRVKKIEMASSADEVLMEEIREYKEQLTCPSCKVKKKDAVLTKCFHVFCLECLKTRYETRQRKCPKCNATFGANDYHRIYLE